MFRVCGAFSLTVWDQGYGNPKPDPTPYSHWGWDFVLGILDVGAYF